MKNILKISLFLAFLLASSTIEAQKRGGTSSHNMLGLKVGMTQFDIQTDNFITNPQYGFIGGLATRGDFYNNLDLQFGISLSNSKIGVMGKAPSISGLEEIDFSLLNAQVHVMLGYKLLGDNRNNRSDFKFTIEGGPVLVVNGRLKNNTGYDEYIIENANIKVEDFTNVSTINITGLGGFSMGIERVRVFGYYQYGFNNFLKKLNEIDGVTQNFKGNLTMLQFGALFYF